jgi:hypothetical protein
MNSTLKRTAAAIALATLIACGGGGDGGTSTGPSAEGVYGGTLTGSTSNAFQLLVLENGEFWAMYGTQTSNFFAIAGFIQGSGTSNNGSFASSNTKDFGFSPARAGSTSATYNAAAKTIAGTVTATGGGSVSFSGGPVPGSLYNYNSAAALSTVSGSWSTTTLTGESVAITIAASGSFTASSGAGCNFGGTVTPRASGKNVFNVALNFGSAPCALAGQSATGIAVAYPLANGQTQLVVAVVDGTRTAGTAAVGTR